MAGIPSGEERARLMSGIAAPARNIAPLTSHSVEFLDEQAARRGALVTAISLTAVLTGRYWFAAAIPVWFCFEVLRMRARRAARCDRFERDFPAFLLSLASSVRTGLDPLDAIGECARVLPGRSLVAEEIGKVRDALERGAAEEAAISRFGADIPHPDIALFRTAFILARREGSSLGSSLERLARTTRQRQSFRRKMRSAVAMQKLSAFGIGGCAVAIGAIQASTNPRAITDAWNHHYGRWALTTGLLLIVSGIGWMMSMARRKL